MGVCSAEGKQCDQSALGSVRTAADVQRVARLASYLCSSTRGWAYPNNPGICTNSRCCLDGSCTGACAYGRISSSCSGSPVGHYSRLCPCHSVFVTTCSPSLLQLPTAKINKILD